MENSIKIQTKVLPSSKPTLPPLVLHVIHLVDSYMLWVGVSSSGDLDDAQRAIVDGSLCKDWACAMPTKMNVGGCEKYTTEANWMLARITSSSYFSVPVVKLRCCTVHGTASR